MKYNNILGAHAEEVTKEVFACVTDSPFTLAELEECIANAIDEVAEMYVDRFMYESEELYRLIDRARFSDILVEDIADIVEWIADDLKEYAEDYYEEEEE